MIEKITLNLIFFIIVNIIYPTIVLARKDLIDLENNAYKSISYDSGLSLISLGDIKLWNTVIQPYLEDPLWKSRDSYDACHHLMIPLHAAFLLKQLQWQQDIMHTFSVFWLTIQLVWSWGKSSVLIGCIISTC